MNARVQDGIALLERAVALDSTFATAWAELSQAYVLLYWNYADRTAHRLELARIAADRATALAPDAAATHVALGHYHVVASAAKNLRADLFLDVSEHDNEKASEFPMLLETGDITHEQLFAKAEQMPIKERVKVFNGVVRDPAGALIEGVSIEVVRKGSQGRDRIARLKSGKRGQFSARLSAGSYIALFYIPGFQIQMVPFEVTEQGSGDLIVILQLGSTT